MALVDTYSKNELEQIIEVPWNSDSIHLDNIEIDFDDNLVYIFITGKLDKIEMLKTKFSRTEQTLELCGLKSAQYSFDEIIPNITTEYPLIVILDHLEDPHNLGAIVRSSEAFGVDAIIIPNDRSVQITSTVVKTSVGTIEKVKIVNVPNINNAIRKLKDLGYWIVGTDMEGTNYTEIDYKTKIGLVIGNEGKGISKVTTSNCDYIAKIPMKGTVNSLNASVACGIFLSEINRSRGI